MSENNLLIALRNFTRNKISAYDLESTDESIDYIKENKNVRGQSELEMKFTIDEFLEMMNLSESDIWFYQDIRRGNFEFLPYDFVVQDFDEGYGPWYYFDEENVKLTKEIASLLSNSSFEFEDESMKSDLAKKLNKYFESEYDQIIYSYMSNKNEEMSTVANERIENEIDSFLKKFGFKQKGYNNLIIKVSDLMSNLIRYNAYNSDIKELLEIISKDSAREGWQDIGGWDEDRYEYLNDKYFDRGSFNRDVNWSLEKIYDKLSEEVGEENLKKYRELVDSITDKFKMNVVYSLPKNKKHSFLIKGFNVEKNKIIVDLIKFAGMRKTIELSEENFYNLLYQPELFELEI